MEHLFRWVPLWTDGMDSPMHMQLLLLRLPSRTHLRAHASILLARWCCTKTLLLLLLLLMLLLQLRKPPPPDLPWRCCGLPRSRLG